MPLSTLYVTGFTRETRAKELGKVFGEFGPVQSVNIPAPKSDRKRYAFVEFVDPIDAETALARCESGFQCNVAIESKGLCVEWARRNARPVHREFYRFSGTINSNHTSKASRYKERPSRELINQSTRSAVRDKSYRSLNRKYRSPFKESRSSHRGKSSTTEISEAKHDATLSQVNKNMK